MFGGGFGNRTTSAFGQTSTFSRPSTSFASPGFGAGNTSLFGQQTQPTTSLFGSTATAPTFGQQTTTSQSFGGFGQTTNPSIFGTQQATTGTSGTIFGAQNAAANPAGTGLFGSGGSSTFGSNPGFGTFGSSTNSGGLFGQTQQPQTQSSSLFGQSSSTGTGLFGSSTSAFGVSGSTNGTTIKFNPVTGTDTLIKNGSPQNISIKHHCITCMREYEAKSLEELRLEDYLANRKGPSQGTQTGSGLFGSTAQPSLFSSNPSTSSTTTGNLFGSSSFGQSGVFGQTSMQSNNSLFSKSSTTTPFGSTTTTQSSGFSGFGQNNSLFGNTANQAKPAFGTTQPTTSNLFGGNMNTNNAFGTQQNSSFNFGSQQQNQQGIGLFGAQQNKFGFNAPSQTTSSFAFGTNTNPASGTSLFGAKPAGTGFGVTSTTPSTFNTNPFGGNTSGAGGGLFSGGFNKPQTSGFPFGQTSNASTLGNTSLGNNSLFGNNAAKPTSGLFSNTGASSTGLFSGSGFGTNTGLGGSVNTGFMMSGGFGSGTAGLNVLQNSTGSSNITDQIQILSAIPYGNSPLYKHLRFGSGKTDDLLKPSVVVQKPSGDSGGYKVSTQINNIVTRKAHSFIEPAKKSLFDKIDDEIIVTDNSFNQQRQNPRYLKLKPKSIINKEKVNAKGVEKVPETTYIIEEADKENRRSLPSISAERIPTLDKTTSSVDCGNDSTFAGNTMDELSSTRRSLPSNKTAPLSSNDSVNDLHEHDSSLMNELENDEESGNFIVDDNKSHACKIKLRRSDYFTIPNLDDLDEKVDEEGRCIVKNFTIGRRNYGNVVFYDAFDVAGLDLDSIVFFRYKEVEIYPNDDVKPQVGVGLNRRAQVTLDRVWPIDKTTREIIKDPERLKQLNFEAKLKRASAKMNARFIEYRPLPAGSWVFEVEHFSKYGLDDSDDEDVPKTVGRAIENLPSKQIEKPIPHDLKNAFLDKGFGMSKKRGLDGKFIDGVNNEVIGREFSFLDENDEIMTMDDERPHFSPQRNSSCEYNEFPSPTEKLIKKHDSTLHKVQLMKASFYVQDELNDAEISLEKGIPDLDLFATGRVDAYRSTDSPSKNILPLLKTQFTSQFPPPIDIPIADFTDEEYKPPVFSPEVKSIAPIPRTVLRPQRVTTKFRGSVFPTEKSVIKSATTTLCDTGLYLSRHFRIGWSKGLSIVCLSSASNADFIADLRHDRSGRLLAGRTESDVSPNVVTKLQLSTEFSPELLKNVESHLDTCLKASNFDVEDGVPILRPQRGVSTLHEHCEIEEQTVRLEENYDRQVWELMVALWGNIPGLDVDSDIRSHKTKMVRKAALSEWLKNVIRATSRLETSELDSADKVLTLLARGEVHEACQAAVDNCDVNLALLISQIGGNEVTRSLMEQQLKQWHESEADQLIDPARLKIMTLVAGHMLYVSSKGIINTCEHLDWKKVFAIHLWYITRPSDSLIEALSQYESAYKLQENFAAVPSPGYAKMNLEFETSNGRKIYDLCFHLMKLYARRSYSLESVLNPIAYTSNVLDYRLSWFLMITFKSLGYDHLSVESEYSIHTSFAAQLEINGLWHWAVFVLLHIRDLTARTESIQNIIDKNVELLPNSEIGFTEKENFIHETLQIPAEWIFYSKAVLAISSNRMVEAAWYYIKAKRWNEAHDIIMSNLLTKAIINEKYEMLQNMLEEIVASERIVQGWNHRGAVVYDYLTIVNKVNVAISQPVADIAFLDPLQPLLSSVCSKIKYFPTSSSKERLCQAEISKRMIQLIRIILNLQYGKRGMSIRFVVNLVDQLPLPEDYKQQELQEIISWWIDK